MAAAHVRTPAAPHAPARSTIAEVGSAALPGVQQPIDTQEPLRALRALPGFDVGPRQTGGPSLNAQMAALELEAKRQAASLGDMVRACPLCVCKYACVHVHLCAHAWLRVCMPWRASVRVCVRMPVRVRGKLGEGKHGKNWSGQFDDQLSVILSHFCQALMPLITCPSPTRTPSHLIPAMPQPSPTSSHPCHPTA